MLNEMDLIRRSVQLRFETTSVRDLGLGADSATHVTLSHLSFTCDCLTIHSPL